jgi:hypothetical protein
MEDASTFPLILAGPILRRTTPKSVTVWFASSRYQELVLSIYDENGEEIGTSVIQDTPKAVDYQQLLDNRQQIAPLGENLFVTLLTAKPYNNDCFPLDSVLSYSVSIRDLSQPEPQVLPEMADVCLAGETRPTFYITKQLGSLAYGSCRKPHGPSFDDQENLQHKDSLALLADHLQENCRTLANRPSHLFLVGDQIYADEILQFVMPHVQKLAVQLIGHDIPLPGPDGKDIGLEKLSIDERCKLKKTCGLTSDAQDTQGKELVHLMGFGEYAAMYLLALGNRIHFSVPTDAPDSADTQSLRDFLASQAQTRKTLANIATYMMFDDHDVTDDWNLNRSWYNQVQSNPAGNRVVSNALAAFWAFQSWGNMPEGHFPDDFPLILQNHLMQPDDTEAASHFDFTLHEFHRWAFTLPTTPPVFVLDCRTQRDFGTFNSPPNLLDRYAINTLHESWFNMNGPPKPDNRDEYTCLCDAHQPPGGSPIFITGTPVLGFSVIEWAQELLYHAGFLLGVSTGKLSASNLDIESWIANKQGFSGLLNTIRHTLGYEKATFIAGDVHYSFANRASFTCLYDGEKDISTLECLQLTSSALRNTPPTGRYLETLLANAVTKTRRGHSKPETLPWWQRIFFWRFLKKDVWKIEVTGIPGIAKDPRTTGQPKDPKWWEKPVETVLHTVWRLWEKHDGKPRTDPHTYWITCRPNVALVYFKDGEVTRQVLLSGDQREHSLTYTVNEPDKSSA